METIAAESAKFTAPLLCIHGLWCTAAVWRRFMGYCAHRGWTCHAVNLRGRAGMPAVATASFADYLDDVRRAIAGCEVPPVVLGHDLGGLLALYAGAAARAVVALAPLVPEELRSPVPRARIAGRTWALRRRSGPLPAPTGQLALRYFADGPPGGATADSGTVARELARGDFPLPPPCAVPTLLVGGEYDAVSAPTAVEALANRVAARFQVAEGAGHALPWATGWEQQVALVHRWLVRTLGEPLLVQREDEEE